VILDIFTGSFESWFFQNILTVIAIFLAGFSWRSSKSSAKSSAKSASVAERQLDLVTRRVQMIDQTDQMVEVLPAWFMGRMTSDWWSFGLIMDNGLVFPIRCIKAISDDGRWLEVELMVKGDNIHTFPDSPVADMKLVYALSGRTDANIQVSKIVCAIDLANT
jgi:hypothetical protein